MKQILYSSGEPGGIGPDIILSLASSASWENIEPPVICIGDPLLFEEREKLLKLKIKIKKILNINQAKENKENIIQVYQICKCPKKDAGTTFKSNASYIIRNLKFCVEACIDKPSDIAMVTGPINKENVIHLDKSFTGHTEYIKKISKSEDVIMMLASKKLKVALATTHMPLKNVSQNISERLIYDKVVTLNDELKNKYNIVKPNIAVLGLNPHAGENGKLGDEEKRFISPALNKLKRNKVNVSGPMSADTAFTKKNLKTFDVFFGMYHDQVLPVLKALSFGKSYNITLGVPIIRTSVDHGVALDIAGTGNANTSSLEEAISTAIKLTK